MVLHGPPLYQLIYVSIKGVLSNTSQPFALSSALAVLCKFIMEVFSLSEATDIVERSQKHEKQIDDHQNIQHGSKLRTEESKNE